MRVAVVDPWRMVFEGNVEEAILPGQDGEFSVLDFHQPFLYRLRRGTIQLKRSGARPGVRVMGGVEAEVRIAIMDGVAKMAANELVILIETPRQPQHAPAPRTRASAAP